MSMGGRRSPYSSPTVDLCLGTYGDPKRVGVSDDPCRPPSTLNRPLNPWTPKQVQNGLHASSTAAGEEMEGLRRDVEGGKKERAKMEAERGYLQERLQVTLPPAKVAGPLPGLKCGGETALV